MIDRMQMVRTGQFSLAFLRFSRRYEKPLLKLRHDLLPGQLVDRRSFIGFSQMRTDHNQLAAPSKHGRRCDGDCEEETSHLGLPISFSKTNHIDTR